MMIAEIQNRRVLAAGTEERLTSPCQTLRLGIRNTIDRKGILAYLFITFGITYAIEFALAIGLNEGCQKSIPAKRATATADGVS
jgi:hypothetical protein